MATIREQLDAIEKEIRETPYHKGTEHHIGKLRAKISKLKSEEIAKEQISKGGGGGGYAVKKQGDATVVLVGPPSVGKSTLLTKLTNAKSKIAPYAFTTLTVIPGMMHYNNANIQILDVPGIIGGAEKGKGRGKEVLSVARGADLIIIITDIDNLEQVAKIKTSLYGNGIRLDINPPRVTVEKKARGNIQLRNNIKQDLNLETIKEVAKEFGFRNAEVTIKEKLTMDRLIDAFASNRAYLPSLTIINKSDVDSRARLPDALNISAEKEIGLEALREAIWQKLAFVRVYLVRREEEPSFNNPIIVARDQTLHQIINDVSTDMAKEIKQAKIWGNGAKFPGQTVSLSTKAKDGMQVRFI
ncbi:50S ribosome-binding GTPase [Candidatus Woesebacteria bacterium]|nr:MAG: 50S ribosome-binding GTPase [Candidatus Woesebacteria bacterium]